MNIGSLVYRVLPKKIKNILSTRKKIKESLRKFNSGYAEFINSGISPHEAYLSLVDLFCLTNGKFNDIAHKNLIKKIQNKSFDPINSELLGTFQAKTFKQIDHILNKDGYYIFEQKLDKNLVSRLYEFAKTVPGSTPYSDHEQKFDKLDLPQSEIYRLNKSYLINNLDVQSLIMDTALINIARNYLNAEPIFDYPAMWWSTDFNETASSEAAQLYHFDMERIKWLKIFIYLTDVDEDKGPHCYIKGTHIPGSKPMELLNRGYARIFDEEMHEYYKNEKFITIKGSAGSIFAGDTKCWHKGLNVKSGHRLVLELNYTSNLFGANHHSFHVDQYSSEFFDFCKRNSNYSQRIFIK